ncbi:MAG: DNA-protecting protein DprA [Ruminococcaceae bacterium]|nr:DNA-protecting protein DprA [Oscillospiraceae bacterium]
MLRYWIWLSTRTGVSKPRRLELLRRFGSVQEIYHAGENMLEDLNEAEREALSDKGLKDAETILNECYELGIQLLTWQDAQYPERLRTIHDAPVLLYYKGRLPDFTAAPCIALVGARKASAFGMLTAKRLGYQLGKAGAIVVSGLAEGIDGMGMVGALSADAPVVGVLGCGADVIYPKKNSALYEDTIARGCILTEYPPHTPAIGYHFPVRNRIMSGLCDGVVVVEAAERSGSLITARQALEQGRDIFAVPGNAGSEACAGSNHLLRQGAILAENGYDVLQEYTGRYPGLKLYLEQGMKLGLSFEDLRQNAARTGQNAERKVASKVQTPKKGVDNEEKGNYIELKALMRTLPPTQCAVLEAMHDGPKLVDDIIELAQIPAQEIMSALTMLEIRRLVIKVSANRYKLAEHLIP